jgi:hypothetical protein
MTRRPRLSYSNVVATLALFVSLGLGGAYAAGKITSKDLAKDAVTSKAIDNKTIKGKDVKDGAIGGAQLKDAGIGATEIAAGAVGSAAIADGSVSPADLAASEPPVPLSFEDGGEGDCVWAATLAGVADQAVVTVRRNPFGEVFLDGVAIADDAPGGDNVCTEGFTPEAFEDQTIAILPERFQPANSIAFQAGDDNSVLLVIGDGGAALNGVPMPAGTLLGDSGNAVTFLSGSTWLAADAPAARKARGGGPDELDPALFGFGP